MSKVLTIYSSETHSGKTILGIHLGVSLISETQRSVVLVDLSSEQDSMPAWSMLKLPPAEFLRAQQMSQSSVQRHLQYHSSQLALLRVDLSITQEEIDGQDAVHVLFQWLRDLFDYIIIDCSSHLHHMAYKVVDEADTLLILTSSPEREYPIEMIGHHNYRRIINMSPPLSRHDGTFRPELYVLPKDSVTVETFRRSGVPFVIQAPNRPISQAIGRLARDLGEKRFGLALTGGAALGLTQVGILEVLERNRIAIDMMTGASFGALIGAAYARGMEVGRIKQAIIAWARSTRTLSSRLRFSRLAPKSPFKEASLQTLCDTLLGPTYFEELHIPLNVVAIDTRTGESVVFREGRVLDAIEASMRIPGLFVPFKHSEAHLIDGSVIYPVPVSPLNQMGAHITAAVIVTPTPAESQKYFRTQEKGWSSAEHRSARQNYALVAATFDSLMERLTDIPDSPDAVKHVEPDLFIAPKITGICWKDFYRVEDLVDIGIQAAETVVPQLEKLKWG